MASWEALASEGAPRDTHMGGGCRGAAAATDSLVGIRVHTNEKVYAGATVFGVTTEDVHEGHGGVALYSFLGFVSRRALSSHASWANLPTRSANTH